MKRYLVAALAILAVGCHPVNAGPWPTDDVTTTYYDGIGSESPAQARPELYNGMLRLKDVIGARGSASGVCPLDATSKVPLANIPDTLTGKTVSGGTDIAIADGGTGASDATTARANLGCATSGANTDITSISVNNTGLAAKDTDASHALTIKPNSNLTTNRTLSITTGDADRTLDISSGNVTITSTGASILDDTSNAAVLATIGAAARGANTDITSAYLNNTGLKVKDTDATHGLVIAPGSNLTADRQLTITTGDVPRTLDISASNVTISSAAAGLLDDSTQAAMLTTLGAAPLSGATFTGDITTYLAGAPSTGVIYLGNNSGSRYLYYDGARYVMSGAPLWLNGGYVWTEVNDGAGTGLDADTVDGLHASSLATSGANSNITSLTGLTTALSTGQGGTGASSAQSARSNLGLSHSGALATRSSTQSISNGVTTVLLFATESYDTESIHSTVTNTGRLTIPSGWAKARLSGQVNWSINSVGARQVSISKNGSSFAGYPLVSQDAETNGIGTYQNLTSAIVDVVAGDYFEIRVYQDSGGALNTSSDSWFSIERVAN